MGLARLAAPRNEGNIDGSGVAKVRWKEVLQEVH